MTAFFVCVCFPQWLVRSYPCGVGKKPSDDDDDDGLRRKNSPLQSEAFFPESRCLHKIPTPPELQYLCWKGTADFNPHVQGYAPVFGGCKCNIFSSQLSGSWRSSSYAWEEIPSQGPSAQGCFSATPHTASVGVVAQIWPPSPPLPFASVVLTLGRMLAWCSAMGDWNIRAYFHQIGPVGQHQAGHLLPCFLWPLLSAPCEGSPSLMVPHQAVFEEGIRRRLEEGFGVWQ